jgi:hypothetical protein
MDHHGKEKEALPQVQSQWQMRTTWLALLCILTPE